MKSYDVVGYADTENGAAYCVDCGDEETMEPIFAGSEWDSYPVCDNCGETIEDVNLTLEGQAQQDLKVGD